ncbi:kinetochore-associated protein DSN1 homolog [Lampris incognitus]|uniref:kinetochore-associated protein DSN1 homolog n=1 Tax=Lampris incognitus TaxID=2546036 RepID=UPI0024B4A02B|nr:kinetochore-associated protein DSN1 homolog [Lampris incognitus]
MTDAGEGHDGTDKVAVQEGNLEGVVQPVGPSFSPSARRKSWRRATITRRSLSALPNPSSLLCQNISRSLPQQERLEKLMEASMRLAIERTRTLLQSIPNASMESFQKHVEHMQKEWQSVAQDIRSQSQNQERPICTTSDPAVQRAKEQIHKAIHRLQIESESWDALLDKHRSKAEALARKVEQVQEKGATLDPTSIAQSSQHHLIQSKPDYRSLLSRQQPLLHTMEMVIDTQCKMVRQLLFTQERSQLLVKEASKRLATEAGFQDLEGNSIRSLIAALLSSTATS